MSFILEIIRLGLNNLRLHKLRSVLTSLGIILGVAAVIVVVAIGEGNKRAALRDIAALGATNVIVRSTKPPTVSSGSEQRTFIVSYGLTRLDLRRIESTFGDEATIVPLKAAGSEILRGNQRAISQTFGTTPALQRVANLRIARGRYITDEDIETRQPVVVIGNNVAQKFFRLEDPIGAAIRIDDVVVTIVGVMEPVGFAGGSGASLVGRDLNNDVHAPITMIENRFGDVVQRRESGSFSGEQVELSEIYIATGSTEAVVQASERARRIVDVEHAEKADVSVIVPWELLENAKKALLVWNIMLVAIAAISLLVGGIGIMNIMLASVTERTREIGIRRALGATRNHIVLQFLVETGTLSALGGLIGIGLGIGVTIGLRPLVSWLLEMPFFRGSFDGTFTLEPVVTPWSIGVSFAVAAGVGLVFGIYPAIVASRKDPIVALRHD